ncbi:exported protein of unknown function [Pseudomonas sp. JV551A1]|uniref:Uncharacterized protein n=1 Tax=Pseudomonas inefficax TaxID=2078786 RepID=A0AAQ1STP4_9PSED|nr:exported protein of unknown function [Pseudomonas sp. JV551A1]SPO60474.1 exported protein of unknown function [Pseudomonas inefficax]
MSASAVSICCWASLTSWSLGVCMVVVMGVPAWKGDGWLIGEEHRQDTAAIVMTQSVICKRCVIDSASHADCAGARYGGLSEVVQATIGRPALITGLARALQGAPNSIVQ